MTHSIKCFYHFVLSLSSYGLSISASVYISCRYYYSRSWTLQETMTTCAHWKRRWRRENVVNLLVVRLVSNSRFGASHPLSVSVCVCAVCASWNNIINMYKKNLRWKRVYTQQCCHLPMRPWWRGLRTIGGFFISFSSDLRKGRTGAVRWSVVTWPLRRGCMWVRRGREKETDTHRRTSDRVQRWILCTYIHKRPRVREYNNIYITKT